MAKEIPEGKNIESGLSSLPSPRPVEYTALDAADDGPTVAPAEAPQGAGIEGVLAEAGNDSVSDVMTARAEELGVGERSPKQVATEASLLVRERARAEHQAIIERVRASRQQVARQAVEQATQGAPEQPGEEGDDEIAA
jgi:hypothetical protein